MAEALIEAIQDWTIKYVGSEITKTIHESMQEKFATMSSCLKNVVLFRNCSPNSFLLAFLILIGLAASVDPTGGGLNFCIRV